MGQAERWEMRLVLRPGAGPGKLINHARTLGFIWKSFKLGSEMIQFSF